MAVAHESQVTGKGRSARMFRVLIALRLRAVAGVRWPDER
jgi:hypothetical protein